MYLKQNQQIILFTKQFTVCRTQKSENHFQLNDDTLTICKKEVSSKHCTISKLDSKSFEIIVFGTNETYFNGIALTKNQKYTFQSFGKLALKTQELFEICFGDPQVLILQDKWPKLQQIVISKKLDFNSQQFEILQQRQVNTLIISDSFIRSDETIDMHQQFNYSFPPLSNTLFGQIQSLPIYNNVLQFCKNINFNVDQLIKQTPERLFLLKRNQILSGFDVQGRFKNEFGSVEGRGITLSIDDEKLDTQIIVPLEIYYLSIYFCDTTILNGYYVEKTILESQFTQLEEEVIQPISNQKLKQECNRQKPTKSNNNIVFSATESDDNSDIFECIKRSQSISQSQKPQTNIEQSGQQQEQQLSELSVAGSRDDSSVDIFDIQKAQMSIKNTCDVQDTPNPFDRVENNEFKLKTQLQFPKISNKTQQMTLLSSQSSQIIQEPEQKQIFKFDISDQILDLTKSTEVSLYKNGVHIGDIYVNIPNLRQSDYSQQNILSKVDFKDFLNQ